MKIKEMMLVVVLAWSPALSAALITQYHPLASRSYYSFSQADSNGVLVTITSPLSGFVILTIDDAGHTVTLDYSYVSLDGGPFRPNDVLSTDAAGLASEVLVAGEEGEPTYASYGNAALSPYPSICLECGYEMRLDLTGRNPVLLSYTEFNPYDTGAVDFRLYISEVPLPAAAWLFLSGAAGLLGIARRKGS